MRRPWRTASNLGRLAIPDAKSPTVRLVQKNEVVPTAEMDLAVLAALDMECTSHFDEDKLLVVHDHGHSRPALDGVHAIRIARIQSRADYALAKPPGRIPRRLAEVPVFNLVEGRANQPVREQSVACRFGSLQSFQQFLSMPWPRRAVGKPGRNSWCGRWGSKDARAKTGVTGNCHRNNGKHGQQDVGAT